MNAKQFVTFKTVFNIINTCDHKLYVLMPWNFTATSHLDNQRHFQDMTEFTINVTDLKNNPKGL